MVDTLQGFSGAVVGPMRLVLRSKGYTTIGAKEIIMPSNYFPEKIDEKKNARKVDKGLDKARDFAQTIVNGTSRWLRIPLLSDAFYWMVYRPKTWRMIAETGKRFEVDRDKCKGCGTCERLCPVGNVTVDDFPSFGGCCQSCMRCISFCPRGAIFLPGKGYQTYRAVKAKDLLTSV